MKYKIFFSSVQKEFSQERRALKDYIHGDALLSRFFEVFLFEDVAAADRKADQVYLNEVKKSDIYIGLFGDQYGAEDDAGLSSTHKEFLLALEAHKPRYIFVKGDHDAGRQPKMLALIRKAGNELIRRRFNTAPELHAAVYASLVQYLMGCGRLLTGPFDASVCSRATLKDISSKKVSVFLGRAQDERGYALGAKTPMRAGLRHLNLLVGDKPSHAAILLFGNDPQRFLVTSEVKCLHFHGTDVQKPIPSYQIYKGTIFELIDQALDFVMSKIDRSVGTRLLGAQAPVKYDLPREAVAEAIVNAVVHRDYASHASVQLMLFSDRLEVWNPGQLPPGLTIERLKRPHASIPHNPLICEPAFLAHYAEKAGSGILDMIKLCKAAKIPAPDFRQDGGQFVQTLWRAKSAATQSPTQSPTQSLDPIGSVVFALKQGERSSGDLRQTLGVKHRPTFRKNYLHPALKAGLVELTMPDKPNSRLQKYRLTKKGAEAAGK